MSSLCWCYVLNELLCSYLQCWVVGFPYWQWRFTDVIYFAKYIALMQLVVRVQKSKSKSRCPNPGLPADKAIRQRVHLGDLQDWVSHFLEGLYCQPAHNHEPFGWGASTICGVEGDGCGIIVTWYKTREGRVDQNRNNGRRKDDRVYVGRERLRKIIVTLRSNQCCHHDANSTITTRDFFRRERYSVTVGCRLRNAQRWQPAPAAVAKICSWLCNLPAECVSALRTSPQYKHWENFVHRQHQWRTEGGGLGFSTPPTRNSEGRPKSCQTQPDCEDC